MKRLMLVGCLVLACALTAHASEISIVGVPEVRRVMVPTLVYFGGDVELLVRVQVLDDDARPVPEKRVTLSATTKDGGLARLRAFGITDADGMAVVRTVFDLPVLSLKASLVPCLVEPQDECGATLDIDLTRRNDLEVEFGYAQTAQFGTVTSSLVGVPRSSTTGDVLSQTDEYVARATFVRTLFSTGTLARNTQLFASVQGGIVSESDMLFSTGTRVRPAPVELALDAAIWSRFQASVGYAPIIGDRGGHWALSGMWEESVSERFRVAAGYSMYAPQSGSPDQVSGGTHSPKAAVVFQPPSGRNTLSLVVSYNFTGDTTLRESGSTVRVFPGVAAPAVTFAWDVHTGGYTYITCYGQVSQIGTSSTATAIGATVVFRQWAHLR